MRIQTGICVVLFVSFLAAVGWQTAFHGLPEPHLEGMFLPVEEPKFSLASWWNGTFQKQVQGTEQQEGWEQKEGWIDRHVGFRSVWIKTDNQINFSLFRQVPTTPNPQQIILGKDNWLYESGYVDSFLGLERATDAALERFAADMKEHQDALERQNIAFLLVISPSKAAHYPEYLPGWLWRERETIRPHERDKRSDYERLMPLLEEQGIHCVDAVALFRREKEARPDYRLFARGGNHWTYYGASLVVGQMLARLKELTGRDLRQVSCESVTVDCHTTGTDNDLGDVLNLWTPWVTKGPTPHPHLAATGGKWKPNVLCIGDSFSDTLTYVMDSLRVYRRRDTLFLMLMKKMYPEGIIVPIDSPESGWWAETQGRDIVIVEFNEAQLAEPSY
ncbi:MAG: alginate O-acetyltransferase AlgX-related protein [Planctomycetota bacterium]|jgi:hypothetical protein